MIGFATPKDAAIVVSFSPYAPATIEDARAFAERGVAVVAITDSSFSPLAQFAKIWFEVAEADFAGFRSLSATMALAMALAVGVAERGAAGVIAPAQGLSAGGTNRCTVDVATRARTPNSGASDRLMLQPQARLVPADRRQPALMRQRDVGGAHVRPAEAEILVGNMSGMGGGDALPSGEIT